MDITFIGHNAMYFGGPGGLLLDPMLEKMYGDDYTSSPVEIYPPRKVDFNKIPQPGAIVISHEHSDHFQLSSLNKLSREAPIYVGPLMPREIRELVRDLGFSVVEAEFGREYHTGDVLFQLFPAGRETALWESRVSQLYVRAAVEPEYGGAFVTVDALPSEMFIEQVRQGILPRPSVFATSNNAQVTPPGVYGSIDNMYDEKTYEGSGQRSAIPGVEIITSLFDEVITDFPEFGQADLLITGGGFLKDYEQMGPFPLSDQDQIAEGVGRLVDGVAVYGPTPGDRFRLENGGLTPLRETANWVELDDDRWNELKSRRDAFVARGEHIPMKAILPSIQDTNKVAAAIADVERELEFFARLLMVSQHSGQLLAASVRSRRSTTLMLFRLINNNDVFDWAFDLSASKFVRQKSTTSEDCISRYPFGIIANLPDWHAVISGRFQIWDIVGVAMRSWYPPDYGSSPVLALYNGYGEQARPDIAYSVYRQQLAEIVGSR